MENATLVMSNNHQRAIYNIFSEKIIAYSAGLAKALGSVKAGILMAQLLYWQGKGRNKEWVYKTAEDIYEETGLSRREQETAIKICKAKGVLEVRVMGIPGTRHFRVNIEKLIALIASLHKNAKQVCPEKPNSVGVDGQTNTDSTHQNTQIKNEFKNKKSDLMKEMRWPK